MPTLKPHCIAPQNSLQFSIAIALSLILVFASAAAQAKINPRIIGGSSVTSNKYPWMAALVKSHDKSQFCGASLIAARWALTAAHCVSTELAEGIKLVIGTQRLDQATSDNIIAIDAIFVHEQYKPPYNHHDIALLKLSTPVNQARYIALANTSIDTQLPFGTPVTVAGWGRTSNLGVTSNHLLETSIPLRSWPQCYDDYYKEGIELDENMLCAGSHVPSNPKDSCYGDSGGPLFWRDSSGNFQQLGLVAFGSRQGCAQTKLPGVYTRVSQYLDWIEQKQSGLVPLKNHLDLSYTGVNVAQTLSLSLLNNGAENKVLQGLNLIGDTSFQIAKDNCSGQTLAQDQGCQISVRLLSESAGTKSAYLELNSSDGNNQRIPLFGHVLDAAPALGEALDNTSLQWFSGGDQGWKVIESSASTGASLAQSGFISHQQSSVLATQVTGPGTLQFRWQSATEANRDYLNLRVNGTIETSISGDENRGVDLDLPSGTHVVAWEYRKDAVDQSNSAQDFARLDDVRFIDPDQAEELAANTSEPLESNASPKDSGGSGASSYSLLLMLGLLMGISLIRASFFNRASLRL